MKKVMIGILILIPIVVLLIVLAVDAIVSMEVYISVEEVQLVDADGNPMRNITVNTSELNDGKFSITDYLYIKVLPEKATNKTVTWTIEELRCLDDEYQQAYEYYIANKDDPNVAEVKPAAILVDEKGGEAPSNTTGHVLVNSYCSFKLKASAGVSFAYVQVEVVGFDVEKITIANVTSESSVLKLGDVIRLVANYTPIDSKVNHFEWASDNDSIVKIDENGIVRAVGVGTAHITHKASIYSSEESGEVQYITSAPFEIVVAEGASTLYGDKLTTSKTIMTLAELGLPEGYEVVSGGTLVGDILTITGEQAVLRKGEQEFVIDICGSDDIKIVGKDLLDNRNESNNFILEKGKTLKLAVAWLDETKTDPLTDVVWTSSDNDLATVSNGVITAVDNGLVLVTATHGAKSQDIEINVREKVTVLRLETSKLFYEVGVAKETMFASERYVNIAVDNSKEANSTLIRIQGEPAEESKLADFYSSYKFEIVSGQEYAHFDAATQNKIVFTSSGLEGKGRQKVVVRVSALYPKYETMTHYTTEEVSLNVVYGIDVKDAYELKQASIEQRDYAYANEIPTKDYGGFDVFVSSTKTLAITLSGDAVFDQDYVNVYYDEVEVNGKLVKRFGANGRINLYGSLYGNNYRLYSWKEFLAEQYSELIHVAWSDLTISNVRIRPNTLGDDDTTFNNDDTQGLWGDSIDFECIEDGHIISPWARNRLSNITVEFCVLENGLKISSIYNTDVKYDGCIMRNVAQCAFYTPCSISEVNVDGTTYLYPNYSHIHLNNVVASNMLGTLASISYDHYSKDGDDNIRFGQTKDTIVQYMNDNFVSKGFNTELIQTGFLDMYNWQPSSSTNMIKTGNEKIDALIQQAIGALVDNHPDLEPYKYIWKRNGIEEPWFHMGFVCVGISNFPSNEKTFLHPEFEDPRIKHFYARDLNADIDDGNKFLYELFKSLEFHIYLYDKNSPITPESKVPDGDVLINHLHGLA